MDKQTCPLPPKAVVDPRQSRSAQVYELMRDAIISLWLKPGETINEKAVCAQLGVSRTPVREALMRLSSEGLIEIFPHSGTFVSPIKLQDVVEGHIVREALETAVVRRAAGRFGPESGRQFDQLLARQRECAVWQDYEGFHILDEAFHRTISDCSGTPRIWRIIISAKAQLDRVRRLGMQAPGQLQQIIEQHEAIVEALKAGDEAAAAQALKRHLDAVFESIRWLMDQKAEYFSPESLTSRVESLAAEPVTTTGTQRDPFGGSLSPEPRRN